jgi:large subunit ribosomal protein L25
MSTTETHTLQVERRERLGSRYAARERARGKLPCVLYGQSREPAHLLLDAKETIRFFESGERVFTISLGDKQQHVLLKDLQFDYLGTNVIHCDLIRVELDEEVQVNVPLHLVGDAKGADVAGAVLVQKLTEVPVRCSVGAIPDELRLNISELGAGDNMSAADLTMPPGVELDVDPDTIVVLIDVQAEVEEEPSAEAGEVAAEASPEVISEKNEEGDAEAGQAEGDKNE